MHVTGQQPTYYYGENNDILFRVFREAKSLIKNQRVEHVELRTYPNEEDMLKYIEMKKKHADDNGYEIKVYDLNQNIVPKVG